jgi:hypothetical protein
VQRRQSAGLDAFGDFFQPRLRLSESCIPLLLPVTIDRR